MIRVRAHLANGVTRIEVEGHEGHVVDGRACAAVSAITQTALLGLEQIAALYPDLVEVDVHQEDTP